MAEEKILIVEDEAIVAMEIEGRLTKLGYGIAGSVSTGEAAIAAVQTTTPALVLMDIMLSGEIDGVHASAEIRRRFNIPVVFLTAYADEKTLRRAKLTEPFGYLMKPFEELELRTTIEVALYKHAMGKKLQESELLFRTLFERAGDGIFLIETEGDQNGRIKDANKAAARMHGYTVEELRGMNIRDIDTPDAAGESPALISRILKGEWIKKEVEHRRKDGSVFAVEISAGLLELGSSAYILAFDRDITERRKTEDERKQLHQELRETFRKVARSQREWQETFDSITDLVSIHDEHHTIVKANKAFAAHFKLGLNEIVNRKCYDLFHHTDAPVMNCPHTRSLTQNQPVTEEVRDPKTERILLVSTYPYTFPDSEGRGTIHIARDITSEREKEMRLIMSERLASLGQMASGIAHEINNPLAAIAGCSEGLLNRVRQGRFDPDFFANYLTIINEEIARCKGITTSMLSIVRQTSYVQKTVDVHEVLDKTLEIIGFQGRLRTVDVIKEYHEALPFIHGSEGELKQVFLALISNALDALDGKGALTISTDAAHNAVLVRISDAGPGITPEHLQKLFQPFFTTKLDKGGTGLGLSIARKIVDAHHGRIEVSSELSRGTTFTISLPRQSEDEAPQS